MGFMNRNAAKTEIADGIQVPAVTPSPIAQENKTMNTVNPTVTAQDIFADRREWTTKAGIARLALTLEQINEMHPDDVYLSLFAQKKLRLTQAVNATRQDNIAVMYRNKVQDDQLGRALALYEHVKYAAGYVEYAPGFRMIALLDQEGEHDIVVKEERNVVSGHIDYACFYASKAFNNHGQPNGLNQGALNPVNQAIFERVEGYNAWVDAHDVEVKAMAVSWPKIVATKLMPKFEIGANANNFVQINTVKYHIKYESVINKYALLALLMVAPKNTDGVSFEISSRAKSAESTETFLNRAMSNMTWGYQHQLRALSGISYDPIIK